MLRRSWDRVLVLLVSLAGLWPVATRLLRGEVPGQKELPIDGGHGLYIYALVGDALTGHGSFLQTQAMWFPTGRPFLLAVQNVVDAVAAQPFLVALVPQLGLAVFAAGVLVSNGLAGGWLGEQVGGRGWAGPAAASVLALCPYVWGEEQTGRITQTLLAPMVIAVGYAWRASERGKGGVGAGVWLGVAGLGYWFYGVFGAAVVAAVILGRMVERREAWRGLAGQLWLAAGISLLVAAPFAAFSAASWGEMAGLGVKQDPIPNATRLLGGLYWLPHPRIVAYIPQPLYLVGLVAGFGRPRGRPVALLVVTALLCMTALGETVTVGHTHVPTPLWLLKQLPGFSRFWWPHRALAGATVALAVLAALAVARGGWARGVAALGLVVSVAQGVGVPGALSSWRVPERPAFVDRLPDGAVLFLPMLDPEAGKVRFAEWVWHRRPMVNGMSMWDEYLWPQTWAKWAGAEPLVSALLTVERSRPHGRRKPNPNGEAAETPTVAAEVPSLSVDAAHHLFAQGVGSVVADMQRTPAASLALVTAAAGDPTCDPARRFCWWRLE